MPSIRSVEGSRPEQISGNSAYVDRDRAMKARALLLRLQQNQHSDWGRAANAAFQSDYADPRAAAERNVYLARQADAGLGRWSDGRYDGLRLPSSPLDSARPDPVYGDDGALSTDTVIPQLPDFIHESNERENSNARLFADLRRRLRDAVREYRGRDSDADPILNTGRAVSWLAP